MGYAALGWLGFLVGKRFPHAITLENIRNLRGQNMQKKAKKSTFPQIFSLYRINILHKKMQIMQK